MLRFVSHVSSRTASVIRQTTAAGCQRLWCGQPASSLWPPWSEWGGQGGVLWYQGYLLLDGVRLFAGSDGHGRCLEKSVSSERGGGEKKPHHRLQVSLLCVIKCLCPDVSDGFKGLSAFITSGHVCVCVFSKNKCFYSNLTIKCT